MNENKKREPHPFQTTFSWYCATNYFSFSLALARGVEFNYYPSLFFFPTTHMSHCFEIEEDIVLRLSFSLSSSWFLFFLYVFVPCVIQIYKMFSPPTILAKYEKAVPKCWSGHMAKRRREGDFVSFSPFACLAQQ